MARRKGLMEELEKSIKRSFYRDRDDAVGFAREKKSLYGDEEVLEQEGVEGVAVNVRSAE
jgi:hypothetical protein